MTPRRRPGPLISVIGLLALLAVAGVALLAVLGPAIVVLELVVIALAAGLVSRFRFGTRRPPADAGVAPRWHDAPEPDAILGRTAPPSPWVMRWESTPPPSAVPFARDQLTRVLAEWGLTGEAAEPAQLVVTELITNAIDHAWPPVQLTVSCPGTSVRVEVHDASTEPPRLQPRRPGQERGRGLQLTDALSSKWGWTDDAAGKTVWADVLIGWPP